MIESAGGGAVLMDRILEIDPLDNIYVGMEIASRPIGPPRPWRAGASMLQTPLAPTGLRPRFAPREAAVLVLGGPRRGKTTGILTPNVIRWPGPVVSTSMKDEILRETLLVRAARGRCLLFDPAGTEEHPGPPCELLRWSPVVGCDDWGVANRTAARLVKAARGGMQTSGNDQFWSNRATALISPLLFAAALEGEGITTISNWILRKNLEEPRSILGEHRCATTASTMKIARDVLHGVATGQDPDTLANIWATTDQVFSCYLDPHARELGDEPNFDPDEFVTSTDTVYLTASTTDQMTLEPLYVALIEAIRDSAFKHRGPKPRMLWALDEAANIANLPRLPEIVSQSGGQGLSVIAAFQDLSQARARWGRDVVDGFFNLFQIKIIFDADADTLGTISKLLGERWISIPTTSVTDSKFGTQRTEGSQPARVERYAVEELANLPDETVLLLDRAKPSWLRVVPLFRLPRELRSWLAPEDVLSIEAPDPMAIWIRAREDLARIFQQVLAAHGLDDAMVPVLLLGFEADGFTLYEVITYLDAVVERKPLGIGGMLCGRQQDVDRAYLPNGVADFWRGQDWVSWYRRQIERATGEGILRGPYGGPGPTWYLASPVDPVTQQYGVKYSWQVMESALRARGMSPTLAEIMTKRFRVTWDDARIELEERAQRHLTEQRSKQKGLRRLMRGPGAPR